MQEIPNDLLLEILAALPLKSILRYKSVCKSWHSLISTTHFVRKQCKYASENNNHRLVLCNKFNLVQFVDYEKSMVESKKVPIESQNLFQVVGSCNGLLCVLFNSGTMILWNPCIREHKQLPHWYETEEGFNDNFGFGYDSCHDDYKIVRLYEDNKSQISREMYSLKLNSWKAMLELPCGVSILENSKVAILVGSVLYWQALNSFRNPTILRFDLVAEKFSLLALPNVLYKDKNLKFELKNLGGHLSVISYQDNKGHVDIWTGKSTADKGKLEEWMKFVTIPQYDYNTIMTPLALMKTGSILLPKVTLRLGRRLRGFCSFSLGENTFKEIEIEGCQYFCQAFPFTETLVSSNGYGGTVESLLTI